MERNLSIDILKVILAIAVVFYIPVFFMIYRHCQAMFSCRECLG